MKNFFLLAFTVFSLIGCSSNDETIYNYIGTWSGTYEGSENGAWTFVVASDGKVTGTMYSESNNENYHISGFLNSSGLLTAGLVLPVDGQFSGTLTEKGTADGNWTNESPNPTRTGTWKGAKNKTK